MITISDKKQCCGCSACSQICPAKCITMSADSEGFFYPQVDKAECTGCGLCESVCPILNGNRITSEQTVYAAYTEDEIRMSSSSGGIFPLLADTVLAEGGVVFGAAFTRELSVQHIMVSSPDQLKKLQGSKYLQSDINGTYAEVKRQLAEGRRVLFSGTGCQIAGLKKYLGNDPDMLLTVDVICHGVPSENVWRTYLEWLEKENGAAVEKVTLRDKKTGWKTYSVSVEFGNGNKYDQIHKKDLYMQTFLKDICLRPSCYDCRFKPLSSQADITLGDCWGIHKYMPEMRWILSDPGLLLNRRISAGYPSQ